MNRTRVAGALALGLCWMVAGCGLGGPTDLEAGYAGTKNLIGSFGGTTDASAWAPGCRGYVSASPDHQFNAAAALPYLRFIVNGGAADTTLIVQLPDGTYRCNDDFDGLNPMVEGPLPAGLTKVWVGAYSSTATGNYRLGVTTVATTTAGSLGAPAAQAQRRTRRNTTNTSTR